MQQAEKFHFDTVFGEGESPQPSSARPKTRFSVSEVEVIRNQAYADGRTSVEAKAAETCAQALSESALSLNTLFERIASAEHQFKSQAFDLALLTARKIAQQALEVHPEQEIEALVQECLTKLPHEPRIVITIATDIKDAVEPHLMQLAQNQSFTGKIHVVGSTSMSGAQCKIEWSEGGVEKTPEDLGQAIEDLVRSRLASENPTPEQGDLFDLPETGTASEEFPST